MWGGGAFGLNTCIRQCVGGAWPKLSNTKSVTLTQGDKKDNINEFWQTNPHRILGELKLKWVEAYKRYVPTCETTDIDKVLSSLVNCKFDDSTKTNYINILTTGHISKYVKIQTQI